MAKQRVQAEAKPRLQFTDEPEFYQDYSGDNRARIASISHPFVADGVVLQTTRVVKKYDGQKFETTNAVYVKYISRETDDGLSEY